MIIILILLMIVYDRVRVCVKATEAHLYRGNGYFCANRWMGEPLWSYPQTRTFVYILIHTPNCRAILFLRACGQVSQDNTTQCQQWATVLLASLRCSSEARLGDGMKWFFWGWHAHFCAWNDIILLCCSFSQSLWKNQPRWSHNIMNIAS